MTPILSTKDLNLYYREEGTGTPVVLLHGLTLSGLMWTPQVKALSKTYRVIIPDLRGHGKSSAPDHGYTFHDYASDIKRLFDELNMDKAHLIGLSLGGAVAAEFTVAYAESVISTVLISPMPPRFIPGDDWSVTLNKFRSVMNDKGLDSAVENVLLKEPVFGKMNIGIDDWMNLKNAVRQFSGTPVDDNLSGRNDSMRILELLPALETPFLIITGENDYKKFHDAAESLADSLLNVRHLSVKNAGHLCSMEQPEIVNKEILRFLSNSVHHRTQKSDD